MIKKIRTKNFYPKEELFKIQIVLDIDLKKKSSVFYKCLFIPFLLIYNKKKKRACSCIF